MFEEREPEKKDRIQQIAWWVQHAFVPIAVSIIAGLSAVTAAALLKPVQSQAAVPTPLCRHRDSGHGVEPATGRSPGPEQHAFARADRDGLSDPSCDPDFTR